VNLGGIFIGAVLGLLLTRSFWGMLVGAAIGQVFEQGWSGRVGHAGNPANISETFFRCTFTLMGHIAKSDGRISETEIQAARHVMQELKLGSDQVAYAIAYFKQGKEPQFDADWALDQVRDACGPRHDLLRVFLELQLRAAILGNGATGKAHTILVRTAERLGISATEFVHMEAVLRAQYQGDSGTRGSAQFRRGNLDSAYRELEVQASATDAEVTKAYRRQMSRHHPDKLVARGLPESMAEAAKEKTQRIQEAYEAVRAARGMR
jgi:DnaJ like chaperone protein